MSTYSGGIRTTQSMSRSGGDFGVGLSPLFLDVDLREQWALFMVVSAQKAPSTVPTRRAPHAINAEKANASAVVRGGGLEPPLLSKPDPKLTAAA